LPRISLFSADVVIADKGDYVGQQLENGMLFRYTE
jgi:hypothetical protein